jgi:hypothetical protein
VGQQPQVTNPLPLMPCVYMNALNSHDTPPGMPATSIASFRCTRRRMAARAHATGLQVGLLSKAEAEQRLAEDAAAAAAPAPSAAAAVTPPTEFVQCVFIVGSKRPRTT